MYLDEFANWNVDAYGARINENPGVDKRQLPDLVTTHEFSRSSELGLIYNLLRQCMALSIKGGGILANEDYYNDGHVAVTYAEAFGAEDVDQWCLEVVMGDEINVGAADEAQVFWPGMTQGQADVIVAGLSKQKGVAGWPLLASSGRLCDNVYMGGMNSDDVQNSWKNLNLVSSTLKQLVTYGRLYNAFDVALHMLCQTSVHYRAPVAEAVSFVRNEYHLDLPAFESFRFALRGLLNGDMGAVRPSAYATYKAWSTSRDSFWIYAATLRAAAEHRGIVSYGTDFTSNAEILEYSMQAGAGQALGYWLACASSALGKKIYTQYSSDVGCGLPVAELATPFRVVGDISQYNVVQDAGQGDSRRVAVRVWNDERRTALQPRLLFALGILDGGKVGKVVTKAAIDVRKSRRPEAVAMVRGEQVGPYLTMCRAMGWDAVAYVGGGVRLQSWSDNESRMPWTSYDMELAGGAPYDIVDLRWRGGPEKDRVLDPSIPRVYHFEMNMQNVATGYDYAIHTIVGSFPAQGVVGLPPKRGDAALNVNVINLDVALMAPGIKAELSDFGQVAQLEGIIVPGGEPPPLEVEGDEPPDD
ncbi:hypothetical protein MMARV_C018P1 [viral metagenome]|uniref:Capsid protein n=1 Tax=viral metagenome TaxID=1070528 RepID=A0A6L2ZKU3_9ZZZZ